ncbi:MAG TPA: hypothetical protein VEL31_15550 [Ktedonobacteraceae bacterium]|nr:hypothetical protein [Ktedonobacteraceae bacterium]
MNQDKQARSHSDEQSEAATSGTNDDAEHEHPDLRVLPRKESVPVPQTAFGPFQRKARNAGIALDIVQCLPSGWPFTREGIEDTLYDAGMEPGEELIRMARFLWRERPSYLGGGGKS